ncbi:hypothetical protein ACROYT_G034538 [Oculina patagonica]
MGDNRWASGRGRGSSRGIPSLLGDPPAVRFPYQEQQDVRRGMPPGQPWQNGRWEANGEYYDRDFSNEGHPMWDDGPREPQRVFRDGPWYNPGWPEMNDTRNSDRWQNERHLGNRDGERFSSRDSSRPYPNDNFPDNYAQGPRRRDSFEGDSEARPRYEGQRRDLRERIGNRNNNSSHPSYNGRREMKSVVGSSFLTSRENEGRPNSRGSRREGSSSRRGRHAPPDKHDQGRRTSQETNRRDSKEKSQQKTSPSSESPSGKSGRKSSKPRKVTRSEEKKDVSSTKDTAVKSVEANLQPAKDNMLERKKQEETAVTEKEKSGTKSTSASASKSTVGGEKNDSKIEKANIEPSDSKQGTTSTKPLPKKEMEDSKENTSSSVKRDCSSLPKRDSPSSIKKDSSTSKANSTSSAKGNSLADSPPAKRSPPSSAKGYSPSSAKGDSSSSAKGDSSSLTKGDSPPSSKVDTSSSIKRNPPSPTKAGSRSSAKGDSSSSAKEDTSSLTKEDSTPSLETKGGSMITVQEKEDPEKASNKQKDSLSSLKDKDKSTDSSKEKEELNLPFHAKETLVTSLDKKNNLSQNSKKVVKTLPELSDENNVPMPKVGEDYLSSTGKKNDQASSASYFSKNTSSSVPGSGKEKTVDNQAANISSKSKHNDTVTSSATTTSGVGSLPWEQREEELRTLLGIKKEPKDNENQQDITSCTVSKSNKVTLESQTNRAVSSSSIFAVSSLTSGSNKSTTSRYVPVASQLSLSRPQCSFVHIDGVQCGAITWNKYCSYHQRVFKSEEGNTHETGLVSEENQFARNERMESSISPPRAGRQGGTQIFRPTTPPYDPPKRFGVDGRANVISGVKADRDLSSHNKNDRKHEVQSENDRDNKERSKEIDLSSTVSYTALGAAGGPHGNIDLSTTVRGAKRSLLLHGSSTDVSSGPSIDLSNTGKSSRNDETAWY